MSYLTSHHITSHHITYFKYSDDSAILGLLNDNNSITDYQNTISHFTQYCTDSYLELNVDKTKELVFDTAHTGLNPLLIHGKTVEQVDSFTYLGITLDNRLRFDQHITSIQKRFQQRLHVIRKLRSLSVAPHLLLLLYKSIIQPVLLYCSACFYTILPMPNRNKLFSITRIASKIIGLPTPSLSDLNDKAITRLALSITNDTDHPLYRYFTIMPSGRRYRTLKWKKVRFSRSFVPSAIAALNNLRHR